MDDYENISEVHQVLMGSYRSVKFNHLVFSFGWDQGLATKLTSINPKRAEKRIASYVDDYELDRVEDRVEQGKDFSLRMGVKKEGTGNHGMRGDFCLLGVSYSRKKLTLHYRSMELMGGMVYDQAIISYIIDYLGLEVKKIINMCASCHAFALKGNSNEKLFKKMREIYGW